MLEVMLDFIKDPRIPNRCATYHDAVYTIFVAVLHSLGTAIHIAVSKNRNVQARVVLCFGNQRPIGLTFIHLLARTTVNGDGLDSDILEALSHFNDVFGVVVPTQTRLNRHRLIYGFDNLRGHLHHLWNVL